MVSIALDGTRKDNYKIKNGATTVSVPCEVTKAMLTVEGTGTASGTYGDKLSGLTVSGDRETERHGGTGYMESYRQHGPQRGRQRNIHRDLYPGKRRGQL